MSEKKTRFDSIDTLKGFACIAIILIHTYWRHQLAELREIQGQLVGTDPVLVRAPDQSLRRTDRIPGGEQFGKGGELAFPVRG